MGCVWWGGGIGEGGEALVPGAAGSQNTLLCACFSYVTCGLGQLFLKNSSAPLQT